MNLKLSTFLLTLTLATQAYAGVKVASVDLTTSGSNGYLNIALDGRSSELPDVRVFGKTIEISMNKADAFDAISKNVRGAFLSANMLNGKAIIKAVLPYEIPADSVNLSWKNNSVEVSFLRGTITKTAVAIPAAAPVPAPAKTTVAAAPEAKKVSKDHLNEDYLNKLMKDDEPKKVETVKEEVKKDEVSVTQAAPVVASSKKDTNNSGDGFSFAGYAAKFTIFLAMVLGLFYGIVQLLKKGVFNRGKLGFLNTTQMIEVLSTTYVAPKRTLMVVRAHKQIFLVANSESGLTYLSEMTDTSGLLKEGERQITGTNFDLNLGDAELNGPENFRIKEDIMASTPVAEEPKGLAKLANAKDDIVKFSDELKKKAKKLKPIEFN